MPCASGASSANTQARTRYPYPALTPDPALHRMLSGFLSAAPASPLRRHALLRVPQDCLMHPCACPVNKVPVIHIALQKEDIITAISPKHAHCKWRLFLQDPPL